jgi:hypothetical protein
VFDYRATIAAARNRRDVAISEAKAEWRATAAAAAAERDSEIRRLRAEGLALPGISLAVGVSLGVCYEVLLPDERRASYRVRRREYWRRHGRQP